MTQTTSIDDTNKKWVHKLKEVVTRSKGVDYSGLLDLGVVLTGYAEMRHSSNIYIFNQRYVVLTYTTIHWFKSFDEDIFFEEERDSMALSEVTDVQSIDTQIGDKNCYLFEVVGKIKKSFRVSSKEERDQWIGVILLTKSKARNDPQDGVNKKNNLLSNVSKTNSVVLFITIGSNGCDTMMKKGVSFGESITIPNMKKDDTICITLSNGASASISREILKRNNKKDFSVDVVGFPLSSELVVHGRQLNENWKQKFFQILKRYVDHRFCSFLLISILVILLGCIAGLYLIFDEWREVVSGWMIGLVFLIQSFSQLFETDNWDDEQWELKIMEHQLVRSDSRSYSQKLVVPKRYIDGCNGDEVEALRRYKATLTWRASENVDNILNEELPHFDQIKKYFPHYFCGKSRKGNQVYYERPGQTDIDGLKALGLQVDDMVHYYMYMSEFLWTQLDPREEGKTVTVFDLSGVKPGDLIGEGFEYVRKCAVVVQEHYPERCETICVINIPLWFQAIWKVARPLIDENTQRKVRVFRNHEIQKGLEEFIDPMYIPAMYGGKLRFNSPEGTIDPNDCRFNSQEEKAYRAFVHRLSNKQLNVLVR